ncbi:hypothetical protein BG004_000701 [Podila humilis]|nr:hypothetical protein BG004_000701 [Podila humilis]
MHRDIPGEGSTRQTVTASSVSYNIEEETITLEFPRALHVGSSWILDITYIGLVNDKLNGFYRSAYTDANNNIHQLTTTQFESTHARRAFPCWDEPSMKATFALTLVAPQGTTCLSNMSVQSTVFLENGMQEVTFLKTPIMSTYLLAWMIGDFDYIEAYTSGAFSGEPVLCRVYTPVGLADQGHYSLDLAVKLDLVAVPDFAPGAMENWGLITFRMYGLLIEEYGSQDRKHVIAATVIHEISHQWFGNLVTMEWWSDLWLFEGFATHLAYIVVDELFPEWDIWSEFVKRIQEVLKHDSLRTSHPVEVGVANPSDITQIFDEVSYMKGASVLRMLSAWLGQDQLLLGLRKFIHKYMWSNANTEDLWVTLAEECHVDVPSFMRKWTRQTGYPVLTVTELDESTILVRQNIFLSTGDLREYEDNLTWPVPLALMCAGDSEPRNIMLDQKEMILKVDTTRWYKFNMGQTGFYRVSYPSKTLALLGQTFGTGQLNAANRVGLMTDVAALVTSGIAPTSSFLTLLKYFEDEENYMVWTEVSLRLTEMFSVWLEQPEPIVTALLEVQRRLFTKIVKRLGWDFLEGEDPSTGNLRAVAIRFAGRAGDPEIVAEARKRFKSFIRDRDMAAIPPDLRFPVFEIIMRATEGEEEYDAIVNYYRETFIPAEKVVALSVLGYGQSLDLVRRTLAFAMSPEVRTQDILTAIATLRSSVVGRAELWNFMRHHWDILYERHRDDIGFLDYFVVLSIESFSTIERYHEVQEFFANKDTATYDRILATCLEGIRLNILWLERDCKDVEEWLQANGYLNATPSILASATNATTTTAVATESSSGQGSRSSSGTGQHTPRESDSGTSTPLSQQSFVQLRSGYDLSPQGNVVGLQQQQQQEQPAAQELRYLIQQQQQQQQQQELQQQSLYSQTQHVDSHPPTSPLQGCPLQGLNTTHQRERIGCPMMTSVRSRTLEREMEMLRVSGEYEI